MNPIINPWWIYLISRLDNIRNFCDLTMFFTGVITIACLIAYYLIKESTDQFYLTTYTTIQRNVIYNAKRLKNVFDSFADDLELDLKGKDEQTRLKRVEEMAQTCCNVLLNIQKEEKSLNEKWEKDFQRSRFYKKAAIIAFSIFWFMLIVKTIVPNTTVGYQILAASYITPDNLDLAKNTSKEAIEWVIQSIITAVQNMR